MAGDAALDAEQLECDSGFLRAHRVVVADRQDGDVGLVDAADQLHVAEDARVAGEVDLRSVLERDDDPAGSPPYPPSGVELEWNAFVSVNLTPSTSTVPPLFGPPRIGEPCPKASR